MATFSSKLGLGQKAYIVEGSLDFRVREVTVGLVRVERRLPGAYAADEPIYREEYMCTETGIGSGYVYTLGEHIFATQEDAEVGKIRMEQKAYKERAARDKRKKDMENEQQRRELETLKLLKQKYESENIENI